MEWMGTEGGGQVASDCARHHPLQLEAQRVPGTPSTLNYCFS